MAREYALTDGSLLSDDTSAEFITLDGLGVSGSGAAGTVATIVQDSNAIAAEAAGDVVLTASFSQDGNALQADALLAGLPVPAIAYAMTDVILVDDGQRTFIGLGGEYVAKTGATVFDRQLAMAWAQAGDAIAAAATIGAIGSVSLTANITQAGNSLAATADALWGATAAWSQPGNTLVAAGEVKRILLVASGTVEVGGVVAFTQADQVLAGGVINSGANLAGWIQDGNAIVATASTLNNAATNTNVSGDVIVAAAYVAPLTARWTLLNFRRANGTMPTITTFRWAFWDDPTPDLLDVATDHGTATIAPDGSCRLVFENSQLQPGEVGYITLSDTDGSPDVPWRHHSGPVRVN